MKFRTLSQFTSLAALLVLGGCCTPVSTTTQLPKLIRGESVVLASQEPAHLAFAPTAKSPTDVRSTYLNGLPGTVHYQIGRDYAFDAKSGAITRTVHSRIPDFSTNILYGKEDFDHSKFPGYGNGPYLVFIDYVPKNKPEWPMQPSQITLLPQTLQKLQNSEPLKLVAFGDSITAGGEATRPELIYWQRWAAELGRKYPKSKITAVNGATGGDTTGNGLARLDQKVIKENPDLVIVAFGMNDHNIAGFGVPVDAFSKNLETIIDRIRAGTQAEIILVAPFPPNPKWHFGSHQMEAYAGAIKNVASEKKCAFADVYDNWQAIAKNKKPSDLLGNNINHPSDFGHWIYFAVLNQLGL